MGGTYLVRGKQPGGAIGRGMSVGEPDRATQPLVNKGGARWAAAPRVLVVQVLRVGGQQAAAQRGTGMV